MQVRQELRLDSLCTVDDKIGAHSVSNWGGIGPLCHK